MSILDDLNPAQRQAAQAIEGPLLVLAGAGSGKTRVLTYRVAYLVRELGVSPQQIMAVTFTNKAAGEMKERLASLLGQLDYSLWIGTFHALCARLLRHEAQAFGLDSRFTIYDEDDRRALARRVLKANHIDERDLAPRALIAQISRAKNAMLDPGAFAQEMSESPFRRQLAELYAAYEAELRRNNAFDFDDLLVEAVRQFDRHPQVLEKYQQRFRFLLVDEYQDTNRPQYLLCRQLVARHHNLCVVGDDDQSIYQFRGADIRNILDFERDYPEARVVRLEQNYRSTARILEAANAVIRHNRQRKGKELWTQAGHGELIEVIECDTDRAEARYVVEALKRRLGNGCAAGDAAVLYRTNAQSRALEEELQRAKIKYVIVGGIRFYERQEIKDLLAYLRLLLNPADDISLLRIINVPRRGIGDASLNRLQDFAAGRGLSLLAALDHLDQVPGLNARARQNLEHFRDLFAELKRRQDALDLPELGYQLIEQSGYRQMLEEEDTPEAEVRIQNIDQLLADMTEFRETEENPTLEAFLEAKSLMAPGDENSEEDQALTLMTLHSAKGLEFPLVFICGMEENLFPTARALEEEGDKPQVIEEERRLCYVGLTRARERLFLTYARRRYAFGSMIENPPSRFLGEIPPALVSLKQETDETAPRVRRLARPQPARPARRKKAPAGVHCEWDAPARAQAEGFGDLVEQDDFLAVGQWVRHPSWGRGRIVAREGHGEKMKLSIRFGSQVKKVAVAYAQLEPG
jgi:DNA helicase-2/ATP-dependent DNA helicase PcrA